MCYGKTGHLQYAQCVQYLSSRNMKTKIVSRDTIKWGELDDRGQWQQPEKKVDIF